ncbi:MAG: PSD1 domain-containing protein [Planctomycetes bacterium]|nr:PSD1 domain-containing protein [Planctomycetota bacterium]
MQAAMIAAKKRNAGRPVSPLFGLGLVFLCQISLADDPKPKVTFEEHILPIFKARCVKCHAGAEPEQGLRLTTTRELLRGGTSGPAIRIKAAESSLLWEKLASNDMPKGGPALSAEEKGLIRSWINDGATSSESLVDEEEARGQADAGGSDHWSFRPPTRPDIPKALEAGRVRNVIDSFVLAALAAKGLTQAPDASPDILLRRAFYDLIGLPPSPEELREFLADQDEFAYERMIDRLLASPQYGERWARHWLDLAGYADSAGVLSEDRPLPTAYKFRDYVIRAFNSDKPYDRFLQEQLAGDELSDYWTAYETLDRLPDEVVEAITATGYLRCAADSSRPDFSTIKNADAQYFYPTINDTLQIVSSSTMGLTLQCARCHSHKFDPIPQTEYYRLQAVFMSALRPQQWIAQMDRRLQVATASQKKSADELNARLNTEIARLRNEMAALRATHKRKLFDERLATLPEVLRADITAAFGKPADQRTEVDKYLIAKFTAQLQPDDKTLDKLLPETYPEYRSGVDQRNAAIAAQERQRISFDEIRALYDLPGPVTTPLLRRGDALTPGAPVEPGVLSSLTTPVSFQWVPPAADAKTSGRRLAFARWLTQPDHPLTSRVIVNRIWMQHFGEGIVSTPEDFGTLGSSPSHPQLLDWLSREFVDNGWSIKHLHRLIMTSSTYRQRSNIDEATQARATKLDPDNRLLWRQRGRRVDAEPLRDAMLCVAGLLDQRLYGTPVPVARRGDGEVTVADGQNDRRRSIYVQVLRGNPLTILQAHDQPVMETNCTRRSRSTVSTQALTLLNSDAAVAYAVAFADRALRESPDAPVHFTVLAALSREPTADELKLLNDFVADQQGRHAAKGVASDEARRLALADVCHMLLASNEFVYLD